MRTCMCRRRAGAKRGLHAARFSGILAAGTVETAEITQKEMLRMTYTYRPTGVCSSQIDLELEDGVIRSVAFTGGCNGNLQGISCLVKGMDAKEAIGKLQGIRCGGKPTSCPDQLSRALAAALAEA